MKYFIRTNLLLLITLLFSISIGCNLSDKWTNVGNVEGTVTDKSTGNLLSGVTVRIGDKSVETGNNGVYTLVSVFVGDRTVTATKTGYKIYTANTKIQKGTTVKLDIQLTDSTTDTTNQTLVANLEVSNHSFEDLILPEGYFTRPLDSPPAPNVILSADPIPSWTILGNGQAGTLNCDVNHQISSSTMDGENTAWLHKTIISQILKDVLVKNTAYELSVGVGFTVGGGSPGYRIQLLAGNTILAEDNNSLVLQSGELVTSKIRYKSPSDSPLLGRKLCIVIESFGIETIFDDVRLSAIKVP